MMFFFYWFVGVMPLDENWLWGHVLFGTLTVIKALGLVCLFIALCRVVTNHLPLRRFYAGSTRWILIFAGILALSAMHSLPGVAPAAWSKVISIVSLLITVLGLITSRRALNFTILTAIGAAAFASLYVIREQRYYGEDYRPGGMSGDPNYYALLADLWIPFALLWVFSSNRPLWERIFCAGCLVVTLTGCVVAASRGGFLGLTAALLYLLWRSKRRIRNFLLTALVITPVMVFLLSSSHLDRFIHPDNGDLFAEQARLIAWKSGLRMLEAHPLAGIGLDNFEAEILQYEDPAWSTAATHYQPIVNIAHNTYVGLAAEAGIPGLLCFLGMLSAVFYSLERDRRRALAAKRTHLTNIAVGFQAGLLSFGISAFFLSDWWEKMVWLLISLAISLHRMRIRLPRRQMNNDTPEVADTLPIQVSS